MARLHKHPEKCTTYRPRRNSGARSKLQKTEGMRWLVASQRMQSIRADFGVSIGCKQRLPEPDTPPKHDGRSQTIANTQRPTNVSMHTNRHTKYVSTPWVFRRLRPTCQSASRIVRSDCQALKSRTGRHAASELYTDQQWRMAIPGQ